MKKKQRGITLIILIITIIVLLILAGVTLNVLFGTGGILTNADETREIYNRQAEKENIVLAWQNLLMDKYSEGIEITAGTLEQKLKTNGQNVTVEDYEGERFLVIFEDTNNAYLVNKDGNITDFDSAEIGRYNINYVLNGGTQAEGQPTTYYANEIINLLSASKQGYYFGGWYENAELTGSIISKIEGRTGDITLYASWVTETSADIFTYNSAGNTITGFKSDIEIPQVLAIPKTNNGVEITAIGSSAFAGKQEIERVMISDSIKTIGYGAFYNCKGISGEIVIPDSVEHIYGDISLPSWGAFSGCVGITKVTIGQGLTTLEGYTFYGCKGLTEITIPNSVTSIVVLAFDGCTALRNVFYQGSESEWNAISIGTNNTPLVNATKTFGS